MKGSIMTNDLREAMARAIREVRNVGRSSEDCADAALAAIDAAGVAVVPKVATEEMCFAGASQLVKGGGPVATSGRIWAAMLDAAPKVTQP